MTSVKKILEAQTKAVPKLLLEKLITKKADAAGAALPKEVASQFAEHVLSGNTESFIWNDGNEDEFKKISISVTDEDVAELDREIRRFFQESLPEIVKRTAEGSAKDLLKELKKRWPEQSAWEEATTAVFRENLQIRWGKAINPLKMLLTISREIGAEKYKRSRARKRTHLRNVLFRLHTRACQVSNEILTLIESGFADGAMARWRTLYEICVVATVIADFGEEIAKRYVAHQIVESKSAFDEYERSQVQLGFEPFSKRESLKIIKECTDALNEYGKEFASPYGWAAYHLKRKKPIFSDLEAAAGRASMRSYYKMASYNVHATAKGIFFRLGLLDQSGVIAGASYAGFVDPGQNTAFILASITSLLFGPRWTIEDIVALEVIAKLRDESSAAFIRADRKLQRDDALHRKVNKRRAQVRSRQASV